MALESDTNPKEVIECLDGIGLLKIRVSKEKRNY